jgi:hypothetical protein
VGSWLGTDGKEREEKMDISDDAFEKSAFRGPKPFRVRFVERRGGRERL